MFKKILFSTLLAIGLSTTGAIAKSNTDQLLQLAAKHETLSQNIIEAYKKQDRGSSALALIDTLESGQKRLKANIKDPEIDYLLVYLNSCLNDLKKVVKQPYSKTNAQLIATLSASIWEGNHYIAQTLKRVS